MSIPKKTILAIVSLTAAVLLTACSGNNNQGTNANSQSLVLIQNLLLVKLTLLSLPKLRI